MKKLLIPFFCLALSGTAFSQSKTAQPAVQEIVALSSLQQQAKKVMDRYVNAIGGKAKLSSIKSILQEGTISVMGQELETVTKKMGNKLKSEQKMGGQVVATTVFDGTKGYVEQMGQKMDLPEAQAEALKKSKMVEGLEPNYAKITNVTTEDIAGKKYDVITNDGAKMYFDTTTGLLYKAQKDQGTMTINKYITVDGMKFPSEMTTEAQGMEVEITTTKVIINQGVTEEDFK